MSEIRDYTKASVEEFASVLASSEPAPGGGGASAVCAALGCALGEMVGSLTVGKKKYADVEDEIRTLMDECKALREELFRQVPADAEGFLPLAKAYGIPKDDPTRAEKLEAATLTACEVPVRIMELCCEVIEKIAVFAEKGSRLAVSDAGCAAALVKAAAQAAALNILINTKTLRDRVSADRLNGACRSLLARCTARADTIYEDVLNGLLTQQTEGH